MHIFFRGATSHTALEKSNLKEVLCPIENLSITIDGEQCLATVSRPGHDRPLVFHLSEPMYNKIMLGMQNPGDHVKGHVLDASLGG